MTKALTLTTSLSNEICQKLMEGKPLTRIAEQKDYPSLTTIYKWINSNPSFAKQITQARKVGCQTYLDKMITELETASIKDVGLLREKLHHYRWLAQKLLPALYGDKQEIVQDTKIEITWQQPEIKDISPQVVADANGLARVKEFEK
jgi:hypothetical protein|tara:strand:- start:2812 stop:3252 length:441 start_codon:yes stop_codon:yes gene_type:complete